MSEFDLAAHRLKLGAEFPYDAPDSWWQDDSDDKLPPPPVDAAHAAARGIVADMCDRHTIKRGFEGVHEDTRKELVETTAAIIRTALATKGME